MLRVSVRLRSWPWVGPRLVVRVTVRTMVMIVSVRGRAGVRVVHPGHARVAVMNKVCIECSCISHTGTLGLGSVDGVTGVAAFAHGRTILGAVKKGFGGTVQATAYIG